MSDHEMRLLAMLDPDSACYRGNKAERQAIRWALGEIARLKSERQAAQIDALRAHSTIRRLRGLMFRHATEMADSL